MNWRILVAVDDSPAALHAARLAVDLAAGTGGTLLVVTVVINHALAVRLGAGDDLGLRRQRAADTVLRHAGGLAERANVPVETALLAGDPASGILDEARRWPADLIILGRANPSGPGEPYIGRATQHVLEFADVPVLVVPPDPVPRR